MIKKFIPENNEIAPVSILLNKSEIKESDVEEAVEDWENDPPDDKFKEILETEIDE